MLSRKRILRVGLPVVFLVLGVTLYAQSRSNNCGHLSVVAKVMQATGLGHIQPCEVQDFGGTLICTKIGSHCNVGNGPGKCRNVEDLATSTLSCQCVVH